jgi:AraC-like DNA-binding protein
MPRNDSIERADYACINGSDPAELSMVLSSSTSTLTAIPMTKDDIGFNCEFATAGALTIGRCSYKGQIVVERESDGGKYVIFIPRYGSAELSGRKGDILTSPKKGAIIDCQENSRIVLSGPREHLVVAIDQTALQSRLINMAGIPFSGSFNFVPEIDLTAGLGMAIAHTASALHAGLAASAVLRDAPLACAGLTNALLDLVIEAVPHRLSAEMRRASAPMPRHIKRAVEFMKTNMSQPLSLEEIARAVSVSPRTLQQGFMRFKMTTPMTFLHHLRLDAVHQDLMKACSPQSVSDIAGKCGFTHLSRFAADYRKRFGRLPSQTLRASK